jgi:hypothetical protein
MRSKISHLPRKIREQLNTRLDDGQDATQILPWLNRLPVVKQILAGQFDSASITKQNLNDWRGAGFRDWLKHQQVLELAHRIAGDASELNVAVSGNSPAVAAVSNRRSPDAGDSQDSSTFLDKTTQWFSARYIVVAEATLAAMEDRPLEEQETPMRRICRDLSNLRRGDHSAARLQIERDRVELERERVAIERERFELERDKDQRNQVEQFIEWSKQPEIKEQLLPSNELDTREQIARIRLRLWGPPPEYAWKGNEDLVEAARKAGYDMTPKGIQEDSTPTCSDKVQQSKNDPDFDPEIPNSHPVDAS